MLHNILVYRKNFMAAQIGLFGFLQPKGASTLRRDPLGTPPSWADNETERCQAIIVNESITYPSVDEPLARLSTTPNAVSIFDIGRPIGYGKPVQRKHVNPPYRQAPPTCAARIPAESNDFGNDRDGRAGRQQVQAPRPTSGNFPDVDGTVGPFSRPLWYIGNFSGLAPVQSPAGPPPLLRVGTHGGRLAGVFTVLGFTASVRVIFVEGIDQLDRVLS